MSEQQKEFLEEYDKRLKEYDNMYKRMRNLLLSGLAILLTAFLSVSGAYIAKSSTNEALSLENQKDIAYMMDNSASIKAIDRLIITFETQTKVMEQYLPDDVKGAIQGFNKKSSENRAYIMMFNSNIRGEER